MLSTIMPDAGVREARDHDLKVSITSSGANFPFAGLCSGTSPAGVNGQPTPFRFFLRRALLGLPFFVACNSSPAGLSFVVNNPSRKVEMTPEAAYQ